MQDPVDQILEFGVTAPKKPPALAAVQAAFEAVRQSLLRLQPGGRRAEKPIDSIDGEQINPS